MRMVDILTTATLGFSNGAPLRTIGGPALAAPSIRYAERVSRNGQGDVDVGELKRKSWPGVSAEFVRFAIPSELEFRLSSTANVLMLMDMYRADGETTVSGQPRSQSRRLRDKINFIPRGCVMEGWSRFELPSSIVSVHLEPSQDGGAVDLSRVPPCLEFEDRMLRAVMLQFLAVLRDPALDQPGYTETLATLLGFEMLRVCNQMGSASALQGGLTARQIRVVTDYIESHLGEAITIAQMAALLDLSRYHFIRAFKKSVGVPPHQFAIERRVERAKELLTEGQLSLTEVAQKAGFHTPAQLARAFRQRVGATPAMFRRGL